MTTNLKELEELRQKAAEAGPLLEATLAALRDAVLSVNSLGLLAGDLQREAVDCEFEPIPPAVRAHLDGRLLQRTGYVSKQAAETGKRLRELAQGVRVLHENCAQLVALVPRDSADPAAAEGGPA